MTATHADRVAEGLKARRRALRHLADDVAFERTHAGPRDYADVQDLLVRPLAAAVVTRPLDAFDQLVAATIEFSAFCRTPSPRDNRDDHADETEHGRLEDLQTYWLDVLTGRVPEPRVTR